jgi:hypothetical protein
MNGEDSEEILRNVIRKYAPQLLEDWELHKRLLEESKAEYARLMALAKELMAAIETGRLTEEEAEAKWSSEWAAFSKYCGSSVEEVHEPVMKDLGTLLGIKENEKAEGEE